MLIGAKSKVGRTPASSLTDCQSNFHGMLAPLPRKRRGMKVKLNSACDVTSSRLRAGALLECSQWVLICQGRLQHTLPPSASGTVGISAHGRSLPSDCSRDIQGHDCINQSRQLSSGLPDSSGIRPSKTEENLAVFIAIMPSTGPFSRQRLPQLQHFVRFPLMNTS